jgi:3-hydroxyisobutyrate dehydrogenase
MSKTKAAVIGLGSMGFGMAVSLARKGLEVAGSDVNAEAVQRFAAHGRAAKSVAEAAHDAAILVVVVVNAAQTRAVLFGPEGAATTLPKGAVIISSATMSPKDAEALAADAEARGLLYLDAPISGSARPKAPSPSSLPAATRHSGRHSRRSMPWRRSSTGWGTSRASAPPSRW